MEINAKIILLLTIFMCSFCTGNACASNVVNMDISFNPKHPYWPGEQVTVTTTVVPAQAGAYVKLQCEHRGFFASGYTDSNGKFTGVCTIPADALDLVKRSSTMGSLTFTAICPQQGEQATNDQWAQSNDVPCQIVSKAQAPEFPSIALPVATVIGLVAIIGRKKSN
ncbi:MAG: PEF-CTERM sorting domain-containing protein [Alphaproteobacteria bacterium]|nr:MAG: PEF-CTERM sorting domain-containing protein [Alphaproteobacteria bacterium]